MYSKSTFKCQWCIGDNKWCDMIQSQMTFFEFLEPMFLIKAAGLIGVIIIVFPVMILSFSKNAMPRRRGSFTKNAARRRFFWHALFRLSELSRRLPPVSV